MKEKDRRYNLSNEKLVFVIKRFDRAHFEHVLDPAHSRGRLHANSSEVPAQRIHTC